MDPGTGASVSDWVVRDDRDDGVVVLTLHDPDRLNAMTEQMGDAISDVCSGLLDDDDVRCVVLTGAGRAFSAGGDLDLLEELGRRAREDDYDAGPFMRSFYDRFLALRGLPVPVVAAVNGHAIGAGLCVALACDLLLVAADAKVGLNFAQLGLHPGMGGSYLLPERFGTQRGTELLLTGRLLRGEEAAGHGMALQSLPGPEVLPAALELAGRIATSSPLVVRQLVGLLRGRGASSLAQHLDAEAAAQAVNYGSEDLQEGLAAVRERRSPSFR